MKVQSISSNYTNYHNQQNRRLNAGNLSFGRVTLGPTAVETINDCIAAGYSDSKDFEELKKELSSVPCNLKAAFDEFQSSAPKVHSKFAKEAEKYLSKFKNPEDVDLILELRKRDVLWGDRKYTWKLAPDIESVPCCDEHDGYSYNNIRLQYLGKVPYLWAKDCKIGNIDCHDSWLPSTTRYMYRLDNNIIINEINGMVDAGKPASRTGNKIYNANYVCHDVVAQLSDLLDDFDAKCHDALLSVPENFNSDLYLNRNRFRAMTTRPTSSKERKLT